MLVHILAYCTVCFIVPYMENIKFSFEKKAGKEKYGINFFLVGCLIFMLPIMFRNRGGIDDVNVYIKNFYIFTSSMKYVNWYEPFYQFVCHIAKNINASYKFVFFVYGILTAFFWAKGLKCYNLSKADYSLYIALIYVMFYSMMFTIMNQLLAIGIIFCGYNYLEEYRYKYAFCLFVFAYLVHNSAVLPIIILLLIRKRCFANKIIYLLIPVISFLIGALNITGTMLKILPKNLLNDYKYILDFVDSISLSKIGTVNVILFIFYLCYVLLIEKKELTIWSKEILNPALSYFCCIFIFAPIGHLNRIGYYFVFWIPFFLLELLNMLQKNRIRIIFSFFLHLILFLYFIYILQYTGGIFTYYDGSLDII